MDTIVYQMTESDYHKRVTMPTITGALKEMGSKKANRK